MGIHNLTKLIADNVPDAMKENKASNYFARKIAIDASMSLYSFLIAVRPDAGIMLTNEMGEATSHLQGMFSRTIKLIEYGLKPIYVFDGKPPTLKTGELAKRSKKKTEAEEELTTAREEADAEAIEKFSKRTVKVTKEQNEEAKRLLRLMGVPVITAPCEAEAQCAHMAKSGVVYATASEDMDSLTLGTPILLRHLTFSEARKLPVMEIHLDRLLAGLGLTMAQFIDLCILCGCDFCDTIRGIGPKRALELIKKHGSIEEILKHIDSKKYTVPENFPFESVRDLFISPEVHQTDANELKWTDPDEEGLIEFLVKEKGFNEERVRKGIEKLKKNKSTSVQGRLDTFFTATPSTTTTSSTASPQKRKREESKKGGNTTSKGSPAKKPATGAARWRR